MSFVDVPGNYHTEGSSSSMRRSVQRGNSHISSRGEHRSPDPPEMRPNDDFAERPTSPMIVLHGRVQNRKKKQSPQFTEDRTTYEQNTARTNRRSPTSGYHDSQKDMQRQRSKPTKAGHSALTSVRVAMERKSAFSQLSRETQIFGRMVSDLENMLAESGESPEAAWRARILIRSAQETDKELWEKLYEYEKTLNDSSNSGETDTRKAQTACMKLHRDFKRIHKSLVLTLSRFESRQKAEISRLGAVGWSGPDSQNKLPTEDLDADEIEEDKPSEDYYDRALREREEFNQVMRTRELNDINKKMHTVNEIYSDLANIVDDQQEQIDEVEENADYAKYYVQSQQNPSLLTNFFCGGDLADTVESTLRPSKPANSPRSQGSRSPSMKQKDNEYGVIDWGPMLACGNNMELAAESLRESYGIMKYNDKDPSCRGIGNALTDELSNDDSPIAIDPTPISSETRRDYVQAVNPVARLREAKREPTESATEHRNLRVSEDFHWMMPFETLSEDVKAVHSDLLTWGKRIISPNYVEEEGEPFTF